MPESVPFASKLMELLQDHAAFIETDEQRRVADQVLEEVNKYAAMDGRIMERLDSEQEIEIEKFVKREYTRSDESQKAWHVSSLLGAPQGHADAGGHLFFSLRKFKLRYGEPLQFPEFLACNRNYFNPDWTGLRRVKNVVMALEYTSNNAAMRRRNAESTYGDSVLAEQKSLESFNKAFALLLGSNGGAIRNAVVLSHAELKSAIRAATDVLLDDADVSMLLHDFGNGKEVDRIGLQRILTNRLLVRKVEDTRYFVAVSLAEAETLRRIVHIQRKGESLLGNMSNAAGQVALWFIPTTQPQYANGGLVFDASRGWRNGTDPNTGASPYQSLAAYSSLRFFNRAQHFTEPALNVLVRCLQRDFCHTRELFFQTTIGARRRMERKWQETPLSKVFTMANKWVFLKLHATAVFVKQAFKTKGLFLYEAYTAFDFDDNGVLTLVKFFGAMGFLGLPNVTADDVVHTDPSTKQRKNNHDDALSVSYFVSEMEWATPRKRLIS